MDLLKKKKIEVHVPPLKQDIGPFMKKESQKASQRDSEKESQKFDPKRALTREEADEQRYTTSIRWIVEVLFKYAIFFQIKLFLVNKCQFENFCFFPNSG